MGYWIYMQAFLDVALLAAVAALLLERRRRLPVATWQREVTALVDTLSELVVEVDRVTAPAGPSGASPVLHESALAEAVFTGDGDGLAAPAFLPADAQAAPFPEAPADGPAARPESLPPESLPDEVLAFARQGLRPEDIARRVGRPVGEVTLMLGLSRAHAVPAGS